MQLTEWLPLILIAGLFLLLIVFGRRLGIG
jgi:hypothetical protein